MKRPGALLLSAVIAIAAVFTVAAALWWRNTDDSYRHFEGEIFGTRYQVTYRDQPGLKARPEEIRSGVESILQRIDQLASTWKEQSELSRYNRASDKAAFPLSAELRRLIERSREIEQLTGGAFNAEFKPGNIDLSAIAKGHAVDRLAAHLGEDLGIDCYLVEIGGEIKARGTSPKGEAWKVGIYIPPPHSATIATPVMRLADSSIATSGAYFRGNHITDPATGKAVTNPLLSVSVIMPDNTTADALATALYVMGPDKGLAWARQQQVHAIFILKDGTILNSGR